jgi:hypothetical protein
MKLFQTSILLGLLFLAACKEEYDPKVKSAEQSLLVVEGVLNSGPGPTNIRLTRTFKLDDSALLRPELGAQLTVEGRSGIEFPLYDMNGNGNYSSDQLFLDPTEEYRLRISTPGGRQYASEFIPVQKNPPIDSISWKRDEEGVRIFVNTHNPEGNTRYYRWEYDETWELQSSYYSYYKMVSGSPMERQLPEDQVFTCWRHFRSSELLLASTTQLSDDVVFEKFLLRIPEGSDKLSQRYSVLVRQFALTKEAYEFYQLIKKNTESLGSIFDPQPSEITGNIKSLSDPAEKVIGFVTAAAAQEARLFIRRSQVPQWTFRMNCYEEITVPNNRDSIEKYFTANTFLPYSALKIGFRVIEYYGARGPCTDCTLRGGSTEKPWFW